jgi:hypothetical protein
MLACEFRSNVTDWLVESARLHVKICTHCNSKDLSVNPCPRCHSLMEKGSSDSRQEDRFIKL